jgi:hypothetical protein
MDVILARVLVYWLIKRSNNVSQVNVRLLHLKFNLDERKISYKLRYN